MPVLVPGAMPSSSASIDHTSSVSPEAKEISEG